MNGIFNCGRHLRLQFFINLLNVIQIEIIIGKFQQFAIINFL